MTTFTFGDDLEFADLSALERLVAHLCWCDPSLRAFSPGMKPLLLQDGRWTVPAREWTRYDTTQIGALNRCVAATYAPSGEILSQPILVVFNPPRDPSVALERWLPSPRRHSLVALDGRRMRFFPARCPSLEIDFPSLPGMPSEDVVESRRLLSYVDAPRWSLERAAAPPSEDDVIRVGRMRSRGFALVAGGRPLGAADYQQVERVLALAYNAWLHSGTEYLRYGGASPARVRRSLECLRHRFRTLADWMRATLVGTIAPQDVREWWAGGTHSPAGRATPDDSARLTPIECTLQAGLLPALLEQAGCARYVSFVSLNDHPASRTAQELLSSILAVAGERQCREVEIAMTSPQPQPSPITSSSSTASGIKPPPPLR